MRFLLFSLLLVLAIPVLADGPDFAKVRSDLNAALSEYQDLAIDLPFNKVTAPWNERVRERYKEGIRFLSSAIHLVDRDNMNEAISGIRSSISVYRELGLLFPFSEVPVVKTDEIVSRYLKAEDMLRNALEILVTGKPITPVSDVWRKNGFAWKALEGTFSIAEATSECEKVVEPQTGTWRLPKMKYLIQVMPEIKNPADNPAFGKRASTFSEVWTGDPNGTSSMYFYYNFKDDNSGLAYSWRTYSVICVAEDLGS